MMMLIALPCPRAHLPHAAGWSVAVVHDFFAFGNALADIHDPGAMKVIKAVHLHLGRNAVSEVRESPGRALGWRPIRQHFDMNFHMRVDCDRNLQHHWYEFER